MITVVWEKGLFQTRVRNKERVDKPEVMEMDPQMRQPMNE